MFVEGASYRVLEPPQGMERVDGGYRGRFVEGEVVVFSSYTYNSYDGFPMFFFEPREDRSEVVWIGNYSETKESMEKRMPLHFQPMKPSG